MVPLGVAFGWTVVHFDGAHFQLHPSFQDHLLNSAFRTYLEDNVSWALKSHEKFFKEEDTIGGFQLYRKYSRKDVFRILNWDQNPVAQNVGGYIIAKDNSNCPIFVNYHKHEDISSTTRYEDAFLSQELFQWMSKSKRTLTSPDVSTILHHPSLRIPLFVKKSNDEGQDFYYMGELTPLVATATQETMRDEEKGKNVPVVKMHFDLTPAVEDHLYRYITDQA
jgi:hypothetical protein